jgi:hypothetical protein
MRARNHSEHQLTPEDRRRQVASLLATGLLRLGSALRAPALPSQPPPENLPESRANQLAVAGGKSVTVSAG